MLGLRRRPRRPGASLESEVITAVAIMYIIICAMLLGMHYAAPRSADGAPSTSSTSPSHGGGR
jgi:hypothetical protein